MAKTHCEVVSAQLPAPTAQRLRELAAAGDRSLSSEIRRAVREHLEREQPTGDSPPSKPTA